MPISQHDTVVFSTAEALLMCLVTTGWLPNHRVQEAIEILGMEMSR